MKFNAVLRVATNNNLAPLETAIKYITGKELIKDIKAGFGTTEMLAILQERIDKVVQENIYNFSTGSTGTGNLRRSFKAVRSGSKDFEIKVFSDPKEGVKIKSGSRKGKGSYGIFFESPHELKSFIKGKGSDTDYRPFFRPLYDEVLDASGGAIAGIIKEKVRRKLPRGIKPL